MTQIKNPLSNPTTMRLHSGREMPVLAIGTWQLTSDTAGIIEQALAIGYRMIDTSGDYGTQPGIGEGLKRSEKNREDYYVVTKVEETDDAYAKTKKNMEELELEYADLVLVHRPPENGAGEELWEGLIKAREDGLTKDIGVSNYPKNLIEQLIAATEVVPVVNQIEWSPFGHSDTMKEFCDDRNIIIQAYSPLTRGDRLTEERLQDVAAGYDKTPAQLLIRWNLQRGTVPLPKAGHSSHLKENIDVFDFHISEEDMDRLNRLNEHYSSLSGLSYV